MVPLLDPPVRDRADSEASPVTGDVQMGYLNCTAQWCECQAYMEPYNGTTLCANCAHDYNLHN